MEKLVSQSVPITFLGKCLECFRKCLFFQEDILHALHLRCASVAHLSQFLCRDLDEKIDSCGEEISGCYREKKKRHDERFHAGGKREVAK